MLSIFGVSLVLYSVKILSGSKNIIYITLAFIIQVTSAHFIDFSDIHFEANERPEDLYQRLMAFVEDSLLRNNSLTHHGEAMTEDEARSSPLPWKT
jgi:hypothetical protein